MKSEKEAPQFIRVPTRFFELTECGLLNYSTVCLLFLLTRMQGKNSKAWPTQTTLARMMGCTERSIRKSLKELESNGLIRFYRTSKKLEYSVPEVTNMNSALRNRRKKSNRN